MFIYMNIIIVCRLSDTNKMRYRIITHPKESKLHIWVLAVSATEDDIRRDWLYLNNVILNECPADLVYGRGKSRWINARVLELAEKYNGGMLSCTPNNANIDCEEDGEEALAVTANGLGFVVDDSNEHTVSKASASLSADDSSRHYVLQQPINLEASSRLYDRRWCIFRTHVITALVAGVLGISNINDLASVMRGCMITIVVLLMLQFIPSEYHDNDCHASDNRLNQVPSISSSTPDDINCGALDEPESLQLFEDAVHFVTNLKDFRTKVAPSEAERLQTLYNQTLVSHTQTSTVAEMSHSNMSSVRDATKLEYIQLVTKLFPNWKESPSCNDVAVALANSDNIARNLSTSDLMKLAQASEMRASSLTTGGMEEELWIKFSGNWVHDSVRSG